MSLLLRDATRQDVPVVLGLMRDLAAHEREPERCVVSPDALAAAMFGAQPKCHALLAWEAARATGLALWHGIFEPNTGTPGYYVMNLVVAEDRRGRGIGRALLAELARRLQTEGGSIITWGVRAWNEPARGFYRAIGAEEESGLSVRMALTGQPLARLADAA